MKKFAIAAAIGFTTLAFGQAPAKDMSFVTKSELRAVLAKYEPVISKRLNVTLSKTSLTGDGIATRPEIVAEFTRILDGTSKAFRFTPRPFRVVESAIALNKGETAVQLRRLIKLGMAGPVSPLVTNKEGLTPEEFGNALGLFLVQLASYTHQADPKWTPKIQGGG